VEFANRYEITVEGIKLRIAEQENARRRLRGIEWLPVRKAWPYQAIFADDQGRKGEARFSLNAEELLQAVKNCQHRGSRPDLITPYWENKPLRFVMATVENNEGPDWRFRMNMTASSYRTESDRQRKRGWFPLSLTSYGNDAEVRYAALWVRGRAPGSLAPPIVPVDARTLADRAASAVSWAGTGSKEVFIDGARAMGEIVDWRELVAGTPQELRDWQEKLDPKYRVASVSLRNGAGPILFNGVAVQDKESSPPVRLHIEITQEMADQAYGRNGDDGYRMLHSCGSLSPGGQLPWSITQLWVKDCNQTIFWH
jgi:hypothetical protein